MMSDHHDYLGQTGDRTVERTGIQENQKRCRTLWYAIQVDNSAVKIFRTEEDNYLELLSLGASSEEDTSNPRVSATQPRLGGKMFGINAHLSGDTNRNRPYGRMSE